MEGQPREVVEAFEEILRHQQNKEKLAAEQEAESTQQNVHHEHHGSFPAMILNPDQQTIENVESHHHHHEEDEDEDRRAEDDQIVQGVIGLAPDQIHPSHVPVHHQIQQQVDHEAKAEDGEVSYEDSYEAHVQMINNVLEHSHHHHHVVHHPQVNEDEDRPHVTHQHHQRQLALQQQQQNQQNRQNEAHGLAEMSNGMESDPSESQPAMLLASLVSNGDDDDQDDEEHHHHHHQMQHHHAANQLSHHHPLHALSHATHHVHQLHHSHMLHPDDHDQDQSLHHHHHHNQHHHHPQHHGLEGEDDDDLDDEEEEVQQEGEIMSHTTSSLMNSAKRAKKHRGNGPRKSGMDDHGGYVHHPGHMMMDDGGTPEGMMHHHQVAGGSPSGLSSASVSSAEFWNQRYNELKDFKKEFGHVSPCYLTHSQLYSWLHRQKFMCRRGKLSLERQQLLADAGVHFEYHWNEMYQLLKEYKDTHNSVLVDYAIDAKLNYWVWSQIYSWKSGKLLDDRIQKLEELGLSKDMENELRPPKMPPKKKKRRSTTIQLIHHDGTPGEELQINIENGEIISDTTPLLDGGGGMGSPLMGARKGYERKSDMNWMLMYRQLKAYKNEHMSLSVPIKINKKLNLWIRTQRKSWREGRLSEWKLEKLAKIGFSLNSDSLNPKDDEMMMDQDEEDLAHGQIIESAHPHHHHHHHHQVHHHHQMTHEPVVHHHHVIHPQMMENHHMMPDGHIILEEEQGSGMIIKQEDPNHHVHHEATHIALSNLEEVHQ